MNKRSLLILLAALSGYSYADPTGTISKVVCHSTAPVCHVAMTGSPVLAACATSGWHYTFNGTTPEGKNLLSILLAAQLAKQTVTMGGKGVCTLAGGSEDLYYVYITAQ